MRACVSTSKAGCRFLHQRLATLSLQAPRVSAAVVVRPSPIADARSSSSCLSLHTSARSFQAAPAETPTSSAPAQEAEEGSKWKPISQRVGLIAVKRGMTSFFLPNGERIPATVLQVHSNQISAHIGFGSDAKDSTYTALQVAAVDTKSTGHVTKQIKGHLRKAKISHGKQIIREFPVTSDALVPLGTQLSAVHFVPGQSVDVRAITRGHGFQGVMKRHGFHGLRASHGVSISHRSHGSTGANQDPGRVWPGTKMAGRMGGNKHGTIHNLLVVRVDAEKDLIYVKGNVPGPKGGNVTLQDARRPSWKGQKMYRRGRLPTGEALSGQEPDSIYLASGVDKLPFPAGTKAIADKLPGVVEIGLTQLKPVNKA
ncbi:related to MRPL9 - mitochondrial ribosomal protein, large subunit [Melanopsichium pennsylvanicum]|uniref:Large ribosomal subunit protein uL3m n=2 Tax=Melanopsichium pennsylvanicum TaxID=63383 RepID=A0AAJ4XPD4_9BASI|nr:related to MRPL9-mitochondrial ribosomal protein, large subunit [Melanopsichium pennsylvanicum 4]SNX86050.1 related to MRPL9 - mitochondrial ribosomal protein, large subunit [Melanopsichium pennsylvanicum]